MDHIHWQVETPRMIPPLCPIPQTDQSLPLLLCKAFLPRFLCIFIKSVHSCWLCCSAWKSNQFSSDEEDQQIGQNNNSQTRQQHNTAIVNMVLQTGRLVNPYCDRTNSRNSNMDIQSQNRQSFFLFPFPSFQISLKWHIIDSLGQIVSEGYNPTTKQLFELLIHYVISIYCCDR